MSPNIPGAFYTVGVILSIVVMIAWIILPFAMFGIKPLLRELLREQKKTNELLRLRRTPAPTAQSTAKPGAAN